MITPEAFTAIPDNRLLKGASALRNLAFEGPLRAVIDDAPALADLDLVLYDNPNIAAPEGLDDYSTWACMWRRSASQGPFFGSLSPSDFIFLWNLDTDQVDGCRPILHCRVTKPTIFLTDALQPAEISFDPDNEIFLQSVFYPTMFAPAPSRKPLKELPPFLRGQS
ncbi:MAG: hypothetical protein KF904_22280 [Rhodoblastus sp.]|nr:hypothetical protein [Rhodoblastus sp.]